MVKKIKTNSSEIDNQSFAHKAAKICLYAPIIAIAIQHFTQNSENTVPSLDKSVLLLIVSFFLISLISGIIALYGMKKHGKKGILWKSLTGLSITGIIIAIAIPNFFFYREKAVTQYNDRVRKMNDEAMLKMPGWVGVSDETGATIIAFSINDKSELNRTINRLFTTNSSLLKLLIYNPRNNVPLNIDIQNVSFQLNNNKLINSLQLSEIIKLVKDNEKSFVDYLKIQFTVPPGINNGDNNIFMPYGFDWKTVSALNIKINDETITIHGNYLTPIEKLALAQKNK